MGSEKIILTETDLYVASLVGIRRCINSAVLNFGNRGVTKSRMWDVDINGSLGELAFCRLMNIYFSATSEKPDKVDFLIGGVKVEIRTAFELSSRLIIRRGDLDDAVFVLMTGAMLEFEFQGWIWGKEGKMDGFVDAPANRTPAWFVPKESLRGLEELKQILRDRSDGRLPGS